MEVQKDVAAAPQPVQPSSIPLDDAPTGAVASSFDLGSDSSGDRAKLLEDVHQLIMEHVANDDAEDAKVIELLSPDEILARVDLQIRREPRSYNDVVKACRAVLANSVRCVGQLLQGRGDGRAGVQPCDSGLIGGRQVAPRFDTVSWFCRSCHPHFHNQLFAGMKPAGLAGEFLTAASNISSECPSTARSGTKGCAIFQDPSFWQCTRTRSRPYTP